MIVTLSKDGSPDLYLIDWEGNIQEATDQGCGNQCFSLVVA